MVLSPSRRSRLEPAVGPKRDGAAGTYPQALWLSLRTPRSLLHVVTGSGRACCIQRRDFERYLKLYNRLTGQSLRMP
jgi:hypothetical protein